MVRPKKIADIKPILTNVAQTSHYQVFFDGLSSDLFKFIGSKGVNKRFITENAGLLCNSASIPGSSLGTSDIFGNFTGVQEKFAHSRIFTELTLEFYVDKDYKMIKLFEHWMDYIASGADNDGVGLGDRGFYRRFKYPNDYKCDTMSITKFEKNIESTLLYEFVNAFPKAIISMPVTYGTAELLKITVTFNYDRYVVTRS